MLGQRPSERLSNRCVQAGDVGSMTLRTFTRLRVPDGLATNRSWGVTTLRCPVLNAQVPTWLGCSLPDVLLPRRRLCPFRVRRELVLVVVPRQGLPRG